MIIPSLVVNAELYFAVWYFLGVRACAWVAAVSVAIYFIFSYRQIK